MIKQIKDGRIGHPLYYTYENMKSRCYNPDSTHYADYGGRGIAVCTRWLVDFWAFVEDLGERPEGCSMDRLDNDGPYDPRNFRWATASQQSANRRDALVLLTPEEKILYKRALSNVWKWRKRQERKGSA